MEGDVFGGQIPERSTLGESLKPLSGTDRGHGDEFENSDLDVIRDAADIVHSDEISKLLTYLATVSYSSYVREDFDIHMDNAKYALQVMNYRRNEAKGYLMDEGNRLAVHYDKIPFYISGIAFGITAVLTTGDALFHAMKHEYVIGKFLNFFSGVYQVKASSMGMNIVFLFTLSFVLSFLLIFIGKILSSIFWWKDFLRGDGGNTRAKSIRMRNHDVLVNKIKNLQTVAGERARNKDPDRGASGLLRVYLLFITGYVLHKTLNRCHTRFKQDFTDIWVPTIKARLKCISSALWASVIGFIMVLVFKFIKPEYDESFLASFYLVITLPLLSAWFVQKSIYRSVMKQNGIVLNRMQFIERLYSVHVKSDVLKSFKEGVSERERFDFPDIYQYNDIEEYSVWLHKALGALKRHEDETRK